MKTGLYLGEIPIGKIIVTSASSGGINLQSKTIIPTKFSQTITADNNYEGLSSVIVQPIPNNYIDTNGATATADQIQIGKTAYADGKLVTGELTTYGGEIIYNAKNISQSNDKYIASTSISDKCIINKDATISIQDNLSTLGNATADQVLAGNTFTSSAGIAVTGTHVCESGVDVSKVSATAADVLYPKTIIDKNGIEQTGTIMTKSSSDLNVSENKVIIPPGYYASQEEKSISSGALSLPTISISSSGIITATSGVSTAGYISSTTTKPNTYPMTTKGTTTWTPTTTNQTISSGTYLTGTQTILGDSNLVAENIVKGVNIFGVTGTYNSSGGNIYISDQTYPVSSTALQFTTDGSFGINDIKHVIIISKKVDNSGRYIFAIWYNVAQQTGRYLISDGANNATGSVSSTYWSMSNISSTKIEFAYTRGTSYIFDTERYYYAHIIY